MSGNTGKGRPEGSLNKRTILQNLGMAHVLPDALEEKLWNHFLAIKNPAIRFKSFELALKYKHGCPTQTHQVKTEVTLSLSDPERASLDAIIAKLRS